MSLDSIQFHLAHLAASFVSSAEHREKVHEGIMNIDRTNTVRSFITLLTVCVRSFAGIVMKKF